ncbi:hypothetical protein [Chryseobacterium aquaticum]|uniref:Uncharacterized protein n=1 Tax=Chryseobacterium aquaticum subsp. greenlandense TaxID=345663 RepID=A0A101CG36_9FLAO|nr:hypothetical protein [Chryseobacterium aquaticum]KUJ55577.1 hypothetical protein AR686_12250 [Chryseobacterium aquaticum subsp. greenlandense]
MILKILSSIVILNFFFCCNAQAEKKQKINTKFNSDYFKSRKKFYGKLTPEQLKNIRFLIGDELKIELDENKSILINYHQYGENCYVYKLNNKDAEKVIDNTINISSRISEKNNTEDFFIYSDDAFNVERYEKRNNFVKDSGFFSQTVFTLKENCTAFFILKPNGEFLKQYGFDYFTDVENFLKSR